MKVMLRLLPLQKNSVLFIRHPKMVPWSALIQTTLIKFVQLCVVLAPTSTLTRLCSTIVRLEVGVTFRCSLMFQLYPGQTVLVSALNNLECFGYIFKVHWLFRRLLANRGSPFWSDAHILISWKEIKLKDTSDLVNWSRNRESTKLNFLREKPSSNLFWEFQF